MLLFLTLKWSVRCSEEINRLSDHIEIVIAFIAGGARSAGGGNRLLWPLKLWAAFLLQIAGDGTAIMSC